MKRALFKSVNLLGDGLYVGPVAEEWYRLHGQEYDEIHLQTVKNHAWKIYLDMGIPWKVIFEPEGKYDFTFNFDVSEAFQISDKKKCHLVNSYAEMMGISPFDKLAIPNYNPSPISISSDFSGLALVSAFSLSCASRETPPKPPNKMLPWWKWTLLLETMRRHYPGKVRFMGGPDDVVPVEAGLGISDKEYLNGIPLQETMQIMREAKLIVTVDNGLGHLAAAARLNEFLLVPSCLQMHYIVPWGHYGLRTLHVNPITVDSRYINACLDSAILDWKELEKSYVTNSRA